MNKRVYFVRHGEGENNSLNVRGNPDSPLTEKGIKQAKKVAGELSNIDSKTMITSTFQRAKQTSEIISEISGRELIESDLFIERLRPTEQIGMIKDGPESLESQKNYDEAFLKGEKYKDSESFENLMIRSDAALDFLEKHPEDEVIVVTHGMFLRVLVARIILEEIIDPESCFKFMTNFKKHNTGVTIIEKVKDKWKIISWNDHGHVAS